MIPSVSLSAYQAARQHAAFLDRTDDRGRLVVSGQDRAAYLQGLVTNDITALKPGTGCYAAYLTPQGRMISDLFVYELGDVMLLTMDRAAKAAVLEKLDQFIFGEDVTLGDVTGAFAQIAVVGPEAGPAVAGVLDDTAVEMLSTLEEHGNRRLSFHGQSAIVTRTSDAGERGFDIYVERQRADEFKAAVATPGVPELDEGTADAIRIESGVPKFHRDMDENTIPLEAGIEARAISFSKGCYVGQEVIIRVLHRGHGRIARKLVGLTLAGPDVPKSGAPVRSETAEVGQVTSGAASPALGRPIALAYVRREFVQPGTILIVNGVEAVVTTLPFV